MQLPNARKANEKQSKERQKKRDQASEPPVVACDSFASSCQHDRVGVEKIPCVSSSVLKAGESRIIDNTESRIKPRAE